MERGRKREMKERKDSKKTRGDGTERYREREKE